MSDVLYHYSCRHTADRIAALGYILPSAAWRHYDTLMICNGEPMSGLWRAPAVCWFTDMEKPDRGALGLTSHSLDCDRTEYRYTVKRDPLNLVPWLDFAEKHGAAADWLAVLHEGRQPERWFVATNAIPVIETSYTTRTMRLRSA